MKPKLNWLGAILLGLFFFLTDVHIAQRRLLWFDEIGTIKLVKLPDLATLWQVQNSFRGDSAPTIYLLLVRLFYQLTGHVDITARLLSALAMSAALLVVFDCARRLTDGVHGLIALCILASSFLTHYGYEGRAYALVVLFTAIALWLWLHTREDSKAAAAAFGVAIFAGVSVHFYSVLTMVPFVAWELYRWRPWQRLSSKLLAGVTGLLCALGISAQQIMIMHSVGVSPASWTAPSVPALVAVYSEFFRSGPFVLAAFVTLVCLLRAVAKPMADSERLCWLFLTIPIAGWVLAETVTHSFYNRYLIAILPGVAVAFACLVSRHLPQPASLAFLLFLAVLVTGRQIGNARKPEEIEPPSAPGEQLRTREALSAEDVLVRDGKKTIITTFSVVQALRYYSKRPELYLTYGPDEDPYFCQYLGDACWNLDLAKSHAKELAVIYPSDKFLSAMIQAGFQATVKMTSPTVIYFSPR
jgi:4-amino-4-deoxy-L-arabinose transferase-like glycosyltransferase